MVLYIFCSFFFIVDIIIWNLKLVGGLNFFGFLIFFFGDVVFFVFEKKKNLNSFGILNMFFYNL